MLTRADQTVPDAEARLSEALSAGVRHLGFKDVGATFDTLARLATAIRAAGGRSYLEVVGHGPDSEAASARAALTLGIDVLMGGTRPEVVTPILAGSNVRYYPFPGSVVGHPSRLTGSVETITMSARTLLSTPGVHGLDLLAYRFDGDVKRLMSAVREAAADQPVVIAGSLDRQERIEAVVNAGAAGFTVGTAALNGVFPAADHLAAQIAYIHALRDRAAVRLARGAP